MWELLTDAQAAVVAERTHMQKSMLFIYSLSFIKMVFALNFFRFGIRLIKGFPGIRFKIYQQRVPYGPSFIHLFICTLSIRKMMDYCRDG